MGIALPQGDIKHVHEVIKTDDYMGWKSCTMQEAQEAANNGTAAIGISEDRIVVLAANDEDVPVVENTAVMTLSEKTSAYAVEGMSYAIYSNGTTGSGGSVSTTVRKAIIIVPGVTGTELILASTTDKLSKGTQVWPPMDGSEDFTNSTVLNNTLNKLAALHCDSSGNSVYNLTVKNDDNYGALDTYKKLYDNLYSEFGDEREIVFFGYDWRMPNGVSGNLLRKKVNEYDNVIIVAHSMGGLVTSHMLRDIAVRKKIEKVITLGTPYLGSFHHGLLWNNDSHVTSNVDTYYIAGEGKTTTCTYTFKDGFKDSYSTTSVSSGDGTVLSYSATMNDLYPQKTFFVTAGHNTLIESKDIFKFIRNIINGNNILTSGMRSEAKEDM